MIGDSLAKLCTAIGLLLHLKEHGQLTLERIWKKRQSINSIVDLLGIIHHLRHTLIIDRETAADQCAILGNVSIRKQTENE